MCTLAVTLALPLCEGNILGLFIPGTLAFQVHFSLLVLFPRLLRIAQGMGTQAELCLGAERIG